MEDKKYSLGGFTFDTQQEYERAKVELQVILKIKQKYDINNPEDAKNVLDAVNKKGDVFKSSVGKAFINKLKRVSKNENEIHVQKPVPEQKVRYKQEEKVQDRVIIPIIAEGKKKSDIKYHIIFFMTFLFAAIGPYIPNGGEGFGAAVAFTFLLVIGIASIRKIKKNKKKADEYIYNHLTAEEKEEFEKADNYIKGMDRLISDFVLFPYSNNTVLNLILNEKKIFAEQHGILYKCTVEQTDFRFMDDIDITTIFSNLLENALSASALCKTNKEVSVIISSHNNFVIINVKNSCNSYTKCGTFSSKDYGTGLYNVENSVKKYEGFLKISYSQTEFNCNVVLSNTH